MPDVTLPQVAVAAVILLPKIFNMFRRLGDASFQRSFFESLRCESVRVDATSRCGSDLVLQARTYPRSSHWAPGGIGSTDCAVLCGRLSAGLVAERGQRRRLSVSSGLLHGELVESRTLLTSAIAFSVSGTPLITENAADSDNNAGHNTIGYTGTLTGSDTASVDVTHVLHQTVAGDRWYYEIIERRVAPLLRRSRRYYLRLGQS